MSADQRRQNVSWPPQFDPWLATERVREARDRAQTLADAMPVPSPGLLAFIRYCDEQVAAALQWPVTNLRRSW